MLSWYENERTYDDSWFVYEKEINLNEYDNFE